MEMEVNPEYLKVLGKLENVWEHKQTELGVYKRDLDEAMYAIRQLGSRPVLPEEAAQFKEVVKGMISTYIRKNHDYGNSFDKSLDKFGLVASVVRIGDKMNRIESLVQKKAMVQDESIRDTLLDMANYAIMTVMWMDNQNKYE
ncbi:DUF1599 domain-containing protein [Bacteroides phage PhiCrAssBcn1]|nr:DUF1599 domain-containing protein [Bacteroides phage PhiCrAssBcn1]